MSDSPNLGLPFIEAAQAQKHVTHNEALALLDALAQIAIQDMAAAAPPASPDEGARHVVASGATGDFAGQDGKLAIFDAGAWRFVAPQPGWLAWSIQMSEFRVFDGVAWAPLGDTIRRLQNVDLVGLGTSADAANPLAAKLNAALFTAKYGGEGGSGDLRIALNKENASRTVSQVYQTNWSGRAETGLAGDDNYRIKVSSDGSSWIDAFEIDCANGQSRHVCGSASAPGQSFIGDADTGFTNPAPNTIGVVTDGTQRGVVTSAGNFGFGTGSPAERAHVVGNLRVDGVAVGTAVTQSATDRTANRLLKVFDFGVGATETQRGNHHVSLNVPVLPGGDGGHTSGNKYLLLCPWEGVGNGLFGEIISSRHDSVTTHGRFLKFEITSHWSSAGGGGRVTSWVKRQSATTGELTRPVKLTYAGQAWLALFADTNTVPVLRAGIMFSGWQKGCVFTWVNHSEISGLEEIDPFADVGAVPSLQFNGADIYHARNISTLRAITRQAFLVDAVERACIVGVTGNFGVGTASPTTTIHANGPIRCGSYTVATVPSASGVGAGTHIYVSNESGGATLAFSDGTNWRRCTDRAVIS